MDTLTLEQRWNELPIGRENAVTYTELCLCWGLNQRSVRNLLHELSRYDSGDNYILIRSANGRGFYRTDNTAEIEAYKRECLKKGRSIFAPIKKINRVLNANDTQYSFTNNLRVMRENANISQEEVCEKMKEFDFDKSLLSKMENNVCIPTTEQVSKLAALYGCKAHELIGVCSYLDII